jgi:hypothetical protein
MLGTKFSAIASAAARIAAAGAVGTAALAGAVLIVGPALPGHVVAPRWVFPQPQIQAGNFCELAARRYRDDLNFEPPASCWKTDWFRGSDGHWDRPLPGDWHSQRQAPGAPGDVPPPPGDAPPPPGDPIGPAAP